MAFPQRGRPLARHRRYSFAGLVMAVVASMIVGQTDRGDHMFMAMAQRSAVMARELEGLALLSKQGGRGAMKIALRAAGKPS